jgi:glycosyltransferase involved in cell wall biosynthesis
MNSPILPVKPRICFIVSHPSTIKSFLLPHIKALSPSFNITIFLNQHAAPDVTFPELKCIHIPLHRKPNLYHDCISLIYLVYHLSRSNYSSVHTVTPKAALVGLLASVLARIPIRIHTYTGQIWSNRSGLPRLFLKTIDKLVAFCSTHILVDGHSQRSYLIQHKVLTPSKSSVLGSGSICGVDLSRFKPDDDVRSILRNANNIPSSDFVLLYLGRLNSEKGLRTLAKAFARLPLSLPFKVHLWIVGADEDGTYTSILPILETALHPYHRFEYTNKPEQYMQAADLFCLPSVREGFGLSVIEAAACGLPALVSNIYGLQDAVVHNKTGWFFTPNDSEELYMLLINLLNNPRLISLSKMHATDYVSHNFSQESITLSMIEFYKNLVK